MRARAPPVSWRDLFVRARPERRFVEAQGFKAVPGNTVGAVASRDFVRAGTETVNIAVPQTADVSTFTIGANVSPGSIK